MKVLVTGGRHFADGPRLWAFHANWAAYGRAAGAIRNRGMLNKGKPDYIVACPGGAGTTDMVRRARAAGVAVVFLGEA